MKQSTILILSVLGVSANFTGFILGVITNSLPIMIVSVVAIGFSWNAVMRIARELDGGQYDKG